MKNNRLNLPIDEIPKYKKRALNHGLPRSKHKHIYKTVLLRSYHYLADYKTGGTRITFTELPTKICSICNRIANVDQDSSFYEYDEAKHLSHRVFNKKLSPKALALPRYYTETFRDKFATKEDPLTHV